MAAYYVSDSYYSKINIINLNNFLIQKVPRNPENSMLCSIFLLEKFYQHIHCCFEPLPENKKFKTTDINCWFSLVTFCWPHDHKISLHSRYHFLTPEQLSHISQVANLWFFSKVAVIKKFQYFQNYNRVLHGAAMLDEMAAPYKTLFNFGNIEIFELQLLRQNDD